MAKAIKRKGKHPLVVLTYILLTAIFIALFFVPTPNGGILGPHGANNNAKSNLSYVRKPDMTYEINGIGTNTETNLVIPSFIEGLAVTSIGQNAFASRYALASVTIPETVSSIENGAFSECAYLTKITSPVSVTRIGLHAFKGCSSLRDIYYGGTKEQWASVAILSDWAKNSPYCTVHCSNGDLTP